VAESADPALAPAGAGSAAPRSGGAIVRSGLLTMLALVALGLTRLVHGALVSRNTDNAMYAVIGTLITTATTAGLFLPGGLSSAASKFIPYQLARGNPGAAQAVYRMLRRAGYASGIGLGVVVAFATDALLSLTPGQAVSAGLLTAAFAVYSVEKAALYGFARVPVYVRLELSGSGLAVLTTVVVLALGWRAYLVPLMLGYSVLAAGAWWTLRTRGGSAADPIRIPAGDRREIIGYVGWASVGGLAGFGFLQLLPLLAGQITTAVQVSYFVAAVTLVAPLYFLPRALSLALFPALAHAHGAGDLDAVRTHTDVSTRALLVVLAPVFAVAELLAAQVLTLFGGAKYTAGTAALQVLLVATYFAVVQVAAVNALSSGTRRQVRIPVVATGVGCLLGLALVVPLGVRFGAAGVAGADLVALIVGSAGPLGSVWRRYDMPWAGAATRSVAVVFGGWAAGVAVHAVAGSGARQVVADLVAAVVVGAVAVVVLRKDLRAIVALARGTRTGTPGPPPEPVEATETATGTGTETATETATADSAVGPVSSAA
jgi:O-antigen/teichoic acid export membrane protein